MCLIIFIILNKIFVLFFNIEALNTLFYFCVLIFWTKIKNHLQNYDTCYQFYSLSITASSVNTFEKFNLTLKIWKWIFMNTRDLCIICVFRFLHSKVHSSLVYAAKEKKMQGFKKLACLSEQNFNFVPQKW